MGGSWWRIESGTRSPTELTDADRELPGGYRTLVRTVPGAVIHLDTRCDVVGVDDDLLDLTGREPDGVLGEHVSSLLPEPAVARLETEIRDQLDGGGEAIGELDVSVRRANDSTIPCGLRVGTVTDDGEFVGVVCVLRERAGESAREGDGESTGARDSGRPARHSGAIFEQARDAMLIADDDGVYVDANPAASDLVGIPREELVGRSIAAFAPEDYDFEAAWNEFLAEGSLRGTFPLVRPDGEERLVDYTAVADVLPGRHLSILRDETDRRRRERQIEHQRERLAALNHLNAVVRAVNAAIVEGSTREEIERAACQSLADSPSYQFAFVAEVDSRSDSFRERVEAGVENYLEEIPLSADSADPAGSGPFGRAVRTHEIQISTDVLADPAFEPWHDDARERGYRAAAAIPITYDGTLYGILGVTTGRRDAFADEEREVVAQLGELLGHAIAALERKRALMSDELIELEFAVHDVFEVLGVPEPTDERIEFEGAVPLGGEEFLTFGTTTPDALPAVKGLEGRATHWESVTVLDENSSDVRFEVHMAGPSVYALVASLGGYVDEAAIADGDFVLKIHLPQGADVRRVIEAVQEAYPNARNVARRQIEREGRSSREMRRALTHELTPRQRTALEIAYHAGYFEWPRDLSGEDLADRLDVSPATFHQHLRAAEGKLFEALLG